MIDSALFADAFAAIAGSPNVAAHVAGFALRTPNAPAVPVLTAEYDLVAIADVNVTDYHKFTKTDQAAADAYGKSGAPYPIGSIETTHGVIRECLPDAVPFMFVSGITDRLGQFDADVNTAVYQQNFVAAHNVGLAVSAMLAAIIAYLSPA